MEERLQKIIARAGVASRRHAEELITAGQVAVNGQVVTELGTKADAARDHIRVSGKLLRERETKVYIMLHKPDGVVSTLRDPEGRRTVADFLSGVQGRVFPVGRLEYHTSGLLLLTNDGDLANRMMRAHALPQKYCVKVSGALSEAELREVQSRGRVKMQRAKGMPGGWWDVTTAGVSKDAFRDALFGSKHPVEKMKRIAVGRLELGPLGPGEYRHVTRDEVAELERSVTRAELHPEGSGEIVAAKGRAKATGRGFRKRKRSPAHATPRARDRFPRRKR
ncbi:MAG TPA: S4 domain-containing protein [Candidatus Acidoferrales bacterium]|nr:S4 domain-containing protein [Candidatus Acidoferrales bacterium]